MINQFRCFLVCFFFIILAVAGCDQKKLQPPAPKPPEVTVASPVVKDITNYAYFTGYTEARKVVELRARVEGYLEKVLFPSGGGIKKGDLLFVIDPKLLEAEVAQRKASLATQRAKEKLAKATLKRKESSYKQRAVSELAVLEEKANVSKTKAEVMGAEAALTEAKLNLSYTKIYSPIAGQISRNFVDAGNLVGSAGDKTLLANIVNIDPIYVYFVVDERSLMLFKKHNKKSLYTLKSSQPHVNLELEGESKYSRQGVIEYMDNTVDLSTGTIQIRATFTNSNLFILPGQYAKIRIPMQNVKNALLVPEVALSGDQRGRYLLTVDADNKVIYSPVEIGSLQGGMRVITKGITPTDRIVVKGIQRAKPGSKVTPREENDKKIASNQAKNS